MKEKSKYGTASNPIEPKSNANCLTQEMIEGLAEEENKDMGEELRKCKSDFKYWVDNYIILPDGYQLVDENGNVTNATKIVLERKKKEYPKTYEECCKVLGINTLGHSADGYKWEILSTFQNLLICRDAYWKLYGEEMRLGKPWSPSDNNKKPIHAITRYDGYIIKDESGGNDEVLEFPTKEMRDAFYEAFRKEIEICKELL